MKKMIAYMRCSTNEQAASGLGLEGQRATIERAAALYEWEIVEWVQDAGISGSVVNRPGLMLAMGFVEAGAAEGLVVSHLSRLSRNAIQIMETVDRANSGGWTLAVLDYQIDTSTPTGRCVATVLAGIVQLYRDQIKESTKAALDAKKARGEKVGGHLKMHPEALDLIKLLHDEGHSLGAIRETLAASPYVPPTGGEWSRSTIQYHVQAYKKEKTA